MKRHDELRAFLHLAGSLSFATTAREHHMAPSALSRTIQRLEAEVGARLFERDRRHVSLTPAGQRFRDYASRAVAEWEELVHDVASSAAPLAGTLRVYCSVTASQSIVPALLARFRQAQPGVGIELETGYASNALEMLRDRVVDVTIAALPDRVPGSVEAVEIADTPTVFVAPTARSEVTALLERRTIPWGDVPMVLPRHGLARRYADEWFRAKGCRPTIASEVEGHEAILSLVALGVGVGVVPLLVLEKSALRDVVRALDVRPPLPRFRIGACVRRQALDAPLVRAFWSSLA